MLLVWDVSRVDRILLIINRVGTWTLTLEEWQAQNVLVPPSVIPGH